MTFHDEKLKDNSFESRVRVPNSSKKTPLKRCDVTQGTQADDYGAQASRDLIVTRGDGFRKEKNKKKRGSYKGGEITVSREQTRGAHESANRLTVTVTQLQV